MKKNSPDNEKKIKLSTLVYTILIVVVVVVGICSILAYGTQTEIGGKISAAMSKVIPFPAAVIDYTNTVPMRDVEKDLASIQKFYQSQDLSKEGLRVDFTTPDGKKRLQIKEREILDKLVEDKIIEILAKKNGISIPQADIDKAVAQKLNEYGTTNDIKSDLLNSYGWSLDDFKKFVVFPSVYKEALSMYISSNKEISENSQSKSKIEQAQSKLKNGEDFAQVVSEYSEGASKDSKGELGWVKKDQVLPELQTALFGANMPAKNSIIESSIGFHIIDVEDKKKNNNEDVLKIRQIFVAKNTFADWLVDQKKAMHVIIPLSGFTWNSSTGSVDFRNEQMRTFEKNERAKSVGDASIMF